MKKALLSLAVLAMSTAALPAQEKGDFTVGGFIGVSGGTSATTTSYQNNSNTTKTPEITSLGFAPQFSYFVIDNLELSAGLEYDMSKEFYGVDNGKNYFRTTNIAMFTIGANYYIPIVKDLLFYTPGVQFGFGGGSFIEPARNTDPNSNAAYSGTETTSLPFAFGFSADLGKFEFKPVEFIGISFNLLDFTVLYNTVKTPVPDYSMSMTNFTAGFDYGMSVGVKYYF